MPNAKRSYVSVLSSDDYLLGMLALNLGLRRVGSAFPLTVLVTDGVGEKSLDILRKASIETIRIPDVPLPQTVRQLNTAAGMGHWNGTFAKLHIFSQTGFAKVVYLDSDMLIRSNIDQLFDFPHMSAVAAGKRFPGNEAWEKLNSGVLVLTPAEGLFEELIASSLLSVRQADDGIGAVGDQDVIQHHCSDWPRQTELHLDERFNMFSYYLDHYVRKAGFKWSGPGAIAVVHFAESRKPWSFTRNFALRYLINLAKKGRLVEAAATLQYLRLIRTCRKEYLS